MLTSYTSRCGLIFFALAWLAPNHFRPWVNFHSEALALAGICMLVANRLLVRRPASALPMASGWIVLAILIPWVQFATGISFFAGDAVVSSLYIAGLLGAFFAGYSYASADQESNPALLGFMHALWIVALLSAFIGLLQWLELEQALQMYSVQGSVGGRAMGNLGQPNQLATLLLTGMAALAFVYESRIIGRFAFFLAITFMSFVLVLTQSRTGLLSVVVLAAFLIWKRRHVELRLSVSAVAVWALAFCIATFLFPYLNSAMLFSDVRGIGAQGAISERFLVWEQIAYAVSQSPWVGYGWNQTVTAQIVAAIAFPGSTPFTYAHNFILDMMAWNGLPLGIVLTGACGYWFIKRLKLVIRLDAVFAMACLLPFAVHSMLEYPFAYSYFLLTAGLMAGVVEASMLKTRAISLNIRWAWAVLCIWAAIGSYLSYEYLLVEEDFRIVRFENLNIGKTPTEYQVPHIWMNTHLAAMLKAARQPAVPGMTAEEINNLKEVALRFPYGPPTFRYALALGLNGDPAGATHQMAIMRGMYGEKYYRATKVYLRALQQEKYPQLKAVMVP
jgi:O-antigen ligase